MDWYKDKEGHIFWRVVANGMSGKEWPEHYTKMGLEIKQSLKSIITNRLVASPAGTAYEGVIYPKSSFPKIDKDGTKIPKLSEVWETAEMYPVQIMSLESVCLFREKFDLQETKKMGVGRMLFMHMPIRGTIISNGLYSASDTLIGYYIPKIYSPEGWDSYCFLQEKQQK